MIAYLKWFFSRFRRDRGLSYYQKIFALSPVNGAHYTAEYLPEGTGGIFRK